MSRRMLAAPLLIALLTLLGCESGTPEVKTYPVHGEVTLDGVPLAEGTISFVDVTRGYRQSIDIKEGKFEGTSQPGKMRVELAVYKEGKIDKMYADDPNVEPPLINTLPEKYNTNSQLTADVKTDGENHFPFELTK